jgi:hypothetical protein
MDSEKEVLKQYERQSEELINEMGISLVLTMMASVPHDKIKALDWWPRAKSALETAADAASCWPQMVSKMASKLQIDATTIATAKEISLIGEQVGTGAMFERFRSICRRDAVFIVAMSQARRDEQRQAKAKEQENG